MLVYKLVAVAAIFLTGIIGGIISKRMGRGKGSGTWLSLGNALSGGVFLGAGLLHMLPDAAEGMGDLLPGMDFPLAFLLAGVGFAFVLFMERVLFTAHAQLEGLQRAEGVAVQESATVYPYVLALVLSVHSIFAGVALGVESTLLGSLAIFIAIVAHKGSAAFALGVGLIRGGVVSGRFWRILILFACMTPLGILLGALFTEMLTGKAEAGFEAVFDGLAAGTFQYVAVLDVIHEEFSQPALRGPKFLVFLCGIGIMAGLALFL